MIIYTGKKYNMSQNNINICNNNDDIIITIMKKLRIIIMITIIMMITVLEKMTITMKIKTLINKMQC